MKPREILSSALIREVFSIRFDSMWRMLGLEREGRLPGIGEEGATGVFDNKGALFLPGGLVFDDSDRKPIVRKKHAGLSAGEFGKRVRGAMRHDNASLLYHDGMAVGVNLDNGFFADVAATILANKQAAMKRRPALEPSPAPRVYSDDITKSHVPTYLEPPYGARTRLSSCISVCLSEPRLYFVACRKEFGLRDRREEKRVWNDIREATRPILGRDGSLLAASHVIVCHATRYRNRSLVGITRILGLGRFGEFATLTLERINKGLLLEAGLGEKTDPKYLLADFHGTRVAGVLRIYAPTKPGKRQKKTKTSLIAPAEDLGLDLDETTREAMERYRLD
jgi:hypothetical protein